jgi:urea transport system substrate-binding protein
VTNDPMEATYVGIHMWAQAVEKAGTTDVDKVRAAMAGQTFAAPSGFTLTMDADQPPSAQAGDDRRDRIQRAVQRGVADRQRLIRAQPWSPYIAGNDKKPDHSCENNELKPASSPAKVRVGVQVLKTTQSFARPPPSQTSTPQSNFMRREH